MRVAEWRYLEQTHPLYDMPPGIDRWPFTPPELEMGEPLREEETGIIVERLEMRMVGFPGAVRVYRQGRMGPTVQEVRLASRYVRFMDLRPVVDVATRWLEAMRQLSQGPYSLRQLRAMGHPYGWGPAPTPWQAFLRPRKIPSMGRHRYLRGIRLRGPMPDRAVINRQSGRLADSWQLEVRPLTNGLVLRFTAEPEYAWYLARGTVRMQAHGPWGPVARRLLPVLLETWRRAAWDAWRRRRAMAGQFGEQATPPAWALEYGGGGWQ